VRDRAGDDCEFFVYNDAEERFSSGLGRVLLRFGADVHMLPQFPQLAAARLTTEYRKTTRPIVVIHDCFVRDGMPATLRTLSESHLLLDVQHLPGAVAFRHRGRLYAVGIRMPAR